MCYSQPWASPLVQMRCISFQLRILCGHIFSLKLATVSLFAPQKFAKSYPSSSPYSIVLGVCWVSSKGLLRDSRWSSSPALVVPFNPTHLSSWPASLWQMPPPLYHVHAQTPVLERPRKEGVSFSPGLNSPCCLPSHICHSYPYEWP